MLDQFGNYLAQLPMFNFAVTPQSPDPVQVGIGAPNSTTAISPMYINSANGYLYINPSLTPGSWILFSGGGGSGSNGLSGTGSPVGSATPNYVGQCYTDITNPAVPGLWISVGLSNSSWTQIA
jgi:hypothetical protein